MVNAEHIVIGLIYTSTSSVLFVINCLVLFILFRYKEFNTNTYRIIKNMIPGCMMQLMSHFIGGIMTLCDSNLDYYLERIAGAWIQSGWFLYLGASLALAVERALTFIIVVDERTSNIASWAFLGFAWFTALVYLVGLNVPGFGFTYLSDHGYFDWFYDKQPGTQHYLTLEMCIDFSILISVLTIYFVVFIRVLMMRRIGGSGSGIASSSAELRILSIAVISFFYESTYLLWFFWGSQLMTPSVLSSFIVQMLWIFDCGLFSVATVLINGSIRTKIRRTFRMEGHLTFVTTMVTKGPTISRCSPMSVRHQ